MENENAWAAQGKKKKRERESKGEKKREGGKRRTIVGERRAGKRQKGETRGRPRSCVAQRETFNSVTPGLNYHAETIVPGKIKKGAPPADAVATFLLRRTAQNRPMKSEREKREEGKLKYGGRGKEKDEEDNDKIPFSSAGPVVALGLTRLRLMEKEKGWG